MAPAPRGKKPGWWRVETWSHYHLLFPFPSLFLLAEEDFKWLLYKEAATLWASVDVRERLGTREAVCQGKQWEKDTEPEDHSGQNGVFFHLSHSALWWLSFEVSLKRPRLQQLNSWVLPLIIFFWGIWFPTHTCVSGMCSQVELCAKRFGWERGLCGRAHGAAARAGDGRLAAVVCPGMWELCFYADRMGVIWRTMGLERVIWIEMSDLSSVLGAEQVSSV